MPPEPEQEESGVERVKKQLYARDAQSKVHARRKLLGKRFDVVQQWREDRLTEFPSQSEEEIKEHELEALRAGRIPDTDQLAESIHTLHATREARQRHAHKLSTEHFMRALLVASAVFFLISGAIATYVLLFSNRQVSCSNVRFEVHGPTSVPSGAELMLNVLMTNNNKTALKDAELTLEYPDATRTSQGVALRYQNNSIGTIEPGETTKYSGRGILNGREQDQKTILSTLTFSIEGSNATWECQTPFVVTLATAPISIAVDALNEISSGQEMRIVVNVTANSEETVPNVRLAVTYPYGFDFQSATPKPSVGESVWNVGDVIPGSSHQIIIKGVVTGFETEQRSVGFELGEADPTDSVRIGTVLQLMEHHFTLTRPFIETRLLFNEETSDTVAYTVVPGTTIGGVLSWKNVLNEPLYDVEVEMVLPETMIDRLSVQPLGGFFRSEVNTVVWTSQTDPALKMVEPGYEGALQFVFDTTKFIERTGANNPSFNLSFDVKARRISDAITVEQHIQNQATREIRFMTNPLLIAGAVYAVGPFTNTGPHPPAADTETTYTTVLKLKNTINDVHDTRVIAELPINVVWLNKVSPDGEKISFNPVSRKIIWDVETLAAGAGYKIPEREVAFQVALTPSVTQIKTLPPLLTNIEFTGVDSFTGTVLQQTPKDGVTTHLKDDPFFPSEGGFVQP